MFSTSIKMVKKRANAQARPTSSPIGDATSDEGITVDHIEDISITAQHTEDRLHERCMYAQALLTLPAIGEATLFGEITIQYIENTPLTAHHIEDRLHWVHPSQRKRLIPPPEKFSVKKLPTRAVQPLIEKYVAQHYRMFCEKQDNQSNWLSDCLLSTDERVQLIHAGNASLFEWYPRSLCKMAQLPAMTLNQFISFMKIRPADLFHLMADMAFTFWLLFSDSLKVLTVQGEFAMFQHKQGLRKRRFVDVGRVQFTAINSIAWTKREICAEMLEVRSVQQFGRKRLVFYRDPTGRPDKQLFNLFGTLEHVYPEWGPLLLQPKAVCAFMIQAIYRYQITELGRADIHGEGELQRLIAGDWTRFDYDRSDDESDSHELSEKIFMDGAIDEKPAKSKLWTSVGFMPDPDRQMTDQEWFDKIEGLQQVRGELVNGNTEAERDQAKWDEYRNWTPSGRKISLGLATKGGNSSTESEIKKGKLAVREKGADTASETESQSLATKGGDTVTASPTRGSYTATGSKVECESEGSKMDEDSPFCRMQ